MALSDILEALTLGGAGAIGGYASAKEQELARQERERERQEQRRYQQEVLALQKRAADRADADAERQRIADIEKGLYEGSLREVQDVLNPAAIRQTASEARSSVARSLDEDLFEGAGKAPAQTYAAQRIAGEAMRPSMSFMEEVPEFTPSETFRERGSQAYGGSAVRPVTPEEIRAREREDAAAEAERKRKEQQDTARLIASAASGNREALSIALAEGLEDEVNAFAAFGKPEEQDLAAKSQEINYLMSQGYTRDEATAIVYGRGPAGSGAGDVDLEDIDDPMVRYIYDQANEVIKAAFGEGGQMNDRIRGYLEDSDLEEGAPDTPLNRRRILETVKREILGIRKPLQEPAPYELQPLNLFTPGILSTPTRVPLRPGTQGSAPVEQPMSESELFYQMYGDT